MDLSLSEGEELLQSTVRSFVERETTTELLVELQENPPGFRPEWTPPMADAGWLGAVVDPDLGGVGASMLEAAIICEELGRGPIPGPFLASSVVSALLLGAAPQSAERDDVLGAIAAGEAIVTPVVREPGRSWQGVQAVAPAGVFPYVPFAAAATHLLVPLAGDGADTLDLALVATDAPGVACRPLSGFLAWNDEVTLSADATRTAPRARGCARDALTAALHRVHVLLAAYQVGGSQAVFERSLDYSSVRKQFGQPIGRFQRVQDHVVDLLNAVDSARWTAYDAIWRIDTAQDAAATAHLAKAVASESYLTATDEAHKVHGGIGVDPQYGLTLYTQLARTLYDFMGDPRWHKRRMTDALVGVPLSVEA